jgi:hypothetical protein
MLIPISHILIRGGSMKTSLIAESTPSDNGKAARSTLTPVVPDLFGVQGQVKRGYEGVREAFVENFVRLGELGGACYAYVHGEEVVDLWGG